VTAARILVVDDDSGGRRLTRATLAKAGFRVAEASDGKAALEAMQADLPDLVLMDVSMPVMDGLEATRRIRANELLHGGHVPIVALTANAMEGDSERCLSVGMDAFLTKPVRQERLEETIQNVIRRFQASAS